MAHLTEQDVLLTLPDLTTTANSTFWVAYSGGLDSQVLLSLLVKIIPKQQLRALHINHGLNPLSESWQTHCQLYCEQQGVAFECLKVVVDASASSLELQARQSRYAVFDSLLGAEDFLLMAHHQDDQMETVLYRLLRGSGPRGIAGIPPQRPIGKGTLLRPLLKFNKAALNEYAKANDLSWIEDSSNKDTSFDRNFLRQDIIPLLKKRWPEAGKSMQRSAELSMESEILLQELAKIDSGNIENSLETSMPIELLNSLDKPRQRNVLRHWFQTLSAYYDLPVPGYEELRRIVDELIPAANDAMPLVVWKKHDDEVQVHRFAGRLFVLKNYPQHFDASTREIEPGMQIELGSNLGSVELLALNEASQDGIPYHEGDELQIRFRDAETEAKPKGRKTRSFKKLYQDYGVPPWLRERIPLLYINGNLAAVADIFICHDNLTDQGQKHLSFNWQRLDIHCGY